eukprot:6185749-Pleurochrysis_carterae.AAC.4
MPGGAQHASVHQVDGGSTRRPLPEAKPAGSCSPCDTARGSGLKGSLTVMGRAESCTEASHLQIPHA